jgi:hypothetical protein
MVAQIETTSVDNVLSDGRAVATYRRAVLSAFAFLKRTEKDDIGVNLPSGVCLKRDQVAYVGRAIREILGAG